MGIFRNLAMAGAVSMAALASTPTYATVWTIDSVLNGTDGGFGASGFHIPNTSSAMSGNPLAGGNISSSGSGGTYNDSTGDFLGGFDFNGVLFTLLGNMKFNTSVDFDLISPEFLALNVVGAGTINGETSYDFGFKSGIVCCGGATHSPNSFIVNGAGTEATLALWGADGFDGVNAYNGASIGMDLRIRFVLADDQGINEVPIPASLPLFGTGLALMGYLGWRRKRKA